MIFHTTIMKTHIKLYQKKQRTQIIISRKKNWGKILEKKYHQL